MCVSRAGRLDATCAANAGPRAQAGAQKYGPRPAFVRGGTSAITQTSFDLVQNIGF